MDKLAKYPRYEVRDGDRVVAYMYSAQEADELIDKLIPVGKKYIVVRVERAIGTE